MILDLFRGTARRFAKALKAQTNRIFCAGWWSAVEMLARRCFKWIKRIVRVSIQEKGWSIVFWTGVFIVMVAAASARQHFGMKRLEPFLLGMSIIATFVFNFFSIFHPANPVTLRSSHYTYPVFLSINLLNGALCLVLTHIFMNASFDPYDSDKFLQLALGTWGMTESDFIYRYHILLVV